MRFTVVTIFPEMFDSVLAASILGQAGYQQVANVAGGLLRWKDEGLPIN